MTSNSKELLRINHIFAKIRDLISDKCHSTNRDQS